MKSISTPFPYGGIVYSSFSESVFLRIGTAVINTEKVVLLDVSPAHTHTHTHTHTPAFTSARWAD